MYKYTKKKLSKKAHIQERYNKNKKTFIVDLFLSFLFRIFVA